MDLPTLSPARQRLLLAAVMSGLLLAMLDQTIVGTALPTITEQLDGGSLYVWAITAYLVPATVSLPLYARLSDRYGRRALLLCGMALFLLGSASAGAAQTMEQLIAARALQGLGAGALEALPFILVADLFGGRRNAALQGALAGLMGVSFIAGPLVGGFLTDHVGWRSVFYVNLPIGIAAMAAVAAVLPAQLGRSERRDTPLDLAGIALLTVGVGLLLVGLGERGHASAGGAPPGWTEPRTGGLIAAGLALLVAFVAVERRAAAPIVPLSLFARRRTAVLLAAAATGGFGLYAGVLLLPRYFQLVRDVSATHSGLLIYPLLLGLVVSVNVGAALIVRRLEFRRVLLGGCALTTLGALGFAGFDAGTPDWQSLLFMALLGFGVGPLLSGVQIAIQRSVAPAAIGGAMGTLLLLRQVGGAVALAAAETVYVGRLHAGETDAARATGIGVGSLALVGAVLAALALMSLPRGGGRLPAPPPAPDAADAAEQEPEAAVRA
ncbi:MFS transporter [Conexibacter woesei]|uniref:Major facilitator superfamily MFS_1 n=1 Tax=Conexibacter woesei (strain DSM 14684 / CCUG 47730 / CIP 108061 / JCM 11494 / NBRC 100937 / ID131577) TaxID=469383 RepID=D3F1V3_CONWI|nr:MFS transporter [Conexibacter woesei]ADB54134.1 major facilitator superfamily MFS_1 [Conexibacter woesei DSM 14684]